ncbi:MAG: FecR domain-containing protein [Candidatus Omnitrophica bacterium]|nr:FecR domain-containing protein [Candidatus Omnitrophota bacterium]MBU0895904.1 FecR domain-containing protein [Candidatus Omnitrophota bacterium]MBU1037446.1 FecR domain-containing protein [Candidatus Omnitrophota bacterium]MBU1808462.1 FecR domain-containing protein [Candidatus Omnitrophota bacterium]
MKILRLACIMVLVLGIATAGYAVEKRNAQVMSINGTAEMRQSGQSAWSPATVGMVLSEGDTMKTSAGSSALLNLDDGKIATVEVKSGSELSISELRADPATDTSQTLLDLAMGEVMIKAQKVHSENSRFEVKTPTSIVGVRGTTFNVKVEAVEE